MRVCRPALIAALSFAALVVQDQASACSRKGGPPSVEETIRQADEIFVAHLVSATESPLTGQESGLSQEGRFDLQGVEGRYVLIESLKGKTAPEGTVNDYPLGPGNCSLGLMPGWDYIFFVRHDPENPGYRWVGMFTGSQPLGPYRESGEEENELTELKRLIQQMAEN